ncbi:Glyoxalase [Frankia sp. Hr75.2]|nr:Glyoxalase [Frankia sp. Hr75.2]
MAARWFSVVVDCDDPVALAEWWATVLGFRVVYRNEREVDIAADAASFPGLVFLRAPDRKRSKNRLHLDLNPDDQAAEVARLLEFGATRVDVGQGDSVDWVVMADPEGNEFCVLARQDGW